VGEVVTGPIATVGGRLRGLNYAEVRSRLGAPSNIVPPPLGANGQPTGRGSVEWEIWDPLTGKLSGTIRLDVPMFDPTATFASEVNPHLSRELPAPDRSHLDDQGVIVPPGSTSAHIEIIPDAALKREFDAKRKGG
jgi:hypothetical protein